VRTTKYARIPMGTLLTQFCKSPNPVMKNVPHRCEPVSCNIFYANVPAVDDGSTATVFFVGTNTNVTDIYGIKLDMIAAVFPTNSCLITLRLKSATK
jgi:hypothetical protein